jgi:hypothetical protein
MIVTGSLSHQRLAKCVVLFIGDGADKIAVSEGE